MSEKTFDGDIYRAAFPSVEVIERDGPDAGPLLRMDFAVFNVWSEIDSALEGHFFERVAPGAFTKTLKENLGRVRVLLSHGKDPSMGMTVLGKIERVDASGSDKATADVSLFRSVPQLLLDGLRAGVYGASFRGKPIKNKVEYTPARSDFNPDGLIEVTRTEVGLKDIGPTPFAQYQETTSTLVRSENDDLAMSDLLKRPEAIRSLMEQGAVALERNDEEPDPEQVERDSTPVEDEPHHSAEEVVQEETKEEIPSWQLNR